ncbi:MAG: beta-ketoacyl-ACP synthase III [bacterium]
MLNIRVPNVTITGIGMHVPDKILDNEYFESYLDTSDEWITQRTGVKQRRIAEKCTPNSDLALKAALEAMEMSGTTPEEIDLIIVATITPDRLFPSTACSLQAKLGAVNAGAFDLLAACSGFVYGLSMAHGQLALGHVKKVLLVGSEVMSSILDYNERGTCVLFGDGAGAVIVEAASEDKGRIIDYIIKADGSNGDILHMPGGGSMNPASLETVQQNMHSVKMEGNKVFKLAVKHMCKLAREIIERNGLTLDDIDLLCIHQANIRIVQSVMANLSLDMDEKSFNNIEKYGNTTAASIPLCMYDAFMEEKMNKGDRVLILTFGAGLTYTAALLEWGLQKAVADSVAASKSEKTMVSSGINATRSMNHKDS